MTPYEIDILLHYYTRGGDYPRMEAPIWRPTVENFIRDGLMTFEDGGCAKANRAYRLTDMGKFYVEHGLCRVPLPVSEWRIPYATSAKD